MKNEESEWISISDFMASTIAILIIIVIALFIRNIAASKPDENKEKIKQSLQAFYDEIGINNKGNISLDLDNLSIIFQDGAFAKSKPCLSDSMKANLVRHREDFRKILEGDENKNNIIVIEGYTDTSRFQSGAPCTCKGGNTYYVDNNVSLSIYRAQEARQNLIEDWGQEFANRVTISGFGATKQDSLLGENNRRVIFKIDVMKK